MPDALSHVAYLSQEIGPRPAGTEEEQQAALYIAEQFQKEAGFSAVIEDFNSTSSADLPRAFCGFIGCAALALSFVFSVLLIPAFVISLIAAVLYLSEAIHKPILSRFMAQGISQNVVAKYDPGYTNTASSRRRKIILVARYDSGKIQPETNGPLLGILPVLQWATLVSMIAIPIVLLIRRIFFLQAEGAAALVLTVLSALLLICAFLPVVAALVHKASAYNEAANANAAGVAVMLEVARRIGSGLVSEAELSRRAAEGEHNVSLHGEAEAELLVPEGARLVYEASQVQPPEISLQSPEERLTAAKAALAAFTGQAVSDPAPVTDISEHLVNVKDMQIDAPTDDSIRAQREETRAALSGEALGETGEADDFVVGTELEVAELDAPELIDLEDAAAAAGAAYVGAALGSAMNVIGAVADAAAGSAGAAAAGVGGEADEAAVPDWFAKARANAQAKNPQDEGLEASQRSRYADAFDSLEAAKAEAAAEAARQAQAAAEEALAAVEAASSDLYRGKFQGELENQHEDSAVVDGGEQTVDGQTLLSGETAAMLPIDMSNLQRLCAQESARPIDQGRISLPHITASLSNPLSNAGQIAAPMKQRAPLADAQESGAAAAKSLLSMLPAIDVAELAAEQQRIDPTSVERTGQAASPSMFADLPSLSGRVPALEVLPTQSARSADQVIEKGQTITDEQEAKTTQSARSLVLPSLSGALGQSALAAQLTQSAQDAQADSASDTNPSLPFVSKTDDQAASVSEDPEASAESLASVGVSKAGAFVSASATSSFDPVGSELIQNVAPDEIYVDDADDSDYDTGITETGAFAGPGYVEMPKSRVRSFFDRFRLKEKREKETSAQEWLDVDDDFDARTVGAERGSWESFRQEEDDFDDDDSGSVGDDSDDTKADRGSHIKRASGGAHSRQKWEGGAFSRRSAQAADSAAFEGDAYAENSASLDDTLVFDPAAYDSAAYNDSASVAFSAQEDFSTYEDYDAAETAAAAAAAGAGAASSYTHQRSADLSSEMRQLYQFRHPDIDTEIWFVALGSELAGNAGTSAFLAEHGSDLRGSIIINLSGLGAGELCLVEREGSYLPLRASSRMKRYVQKASQASGVPAGSASVTWSDLSSTFAIRRGFQAMTIMGMDGDKPAYFAQADDTIENVSIDTLNSNIDFVMELLKKI